jgi:predicted GIY-YIG superfamily endonuclease
MTCAPKVCILNEDDARSLTYGGIAHKCSSRRHHHYSKSKADALVKAGELVWLGKHKKVATFRNARSWMKTYRRNRYGEVITCGMQLVRGGGGF